MMAGQFIRLTFFIQNGICRYWSPNDFTRDYFAVLNENGVKGKFSVLAMPTCQGRLDESINYVPKSHRKRFIREVREGVMPNRVSQMSE